MDRMMNVPGYGSGSAAYRMPYNMRRQTPGMAGGMMGEECSYPTAPPFRCYCHPAQFASVNGQSYANITVAYGNSRPCAQYQ